MTKNIMWSDDERAYLTENFGKISTKEIAESLGRKPAQVASYANYRGLHSSPLRGEKGKGRTHAINENIFETWTPGMAYGLGLIVSDGYVQPRGFSITSEDIELLECAKLALEVEAPIQDVKKSNCYVIQVGSTKLRADLIKLGVHPAKSLTATLPEVPDDIFFHFLRGYFDGDGTVACKTGKSILMSFSSGSRLLLDQISNRLSQLLNIDKRPSKERHGHYNDTPTTHYTLTICGPTAALIGTHMYKDADNLYLQRKYARFVKYWETPHTHKGNPIYEKLEISEEDRKTKLRDYSRDYMRTYRDNKRIADDPLYTPSPDRYESPYAGLDENERIARKKELSNKRNAKYRERKKAQNQ